MGWELGLHHREFVIYGELLSLLERREMLIFFFLRMESRILFLQRCFSLQGKLCSCCGRPSHQSHTSPQESQGSPSLWCQGNADFRAKYSISNIPARGTVHSQHRCWETLGKEAGMGLGLGAAPSPTSGRLQTRG